MFLAIGLMSGTSLDGIDASLIKTDGENFFEQISNIYFPYTNEFQDKLKYVGNSGLNWLEIERELTLYHAECVNEIIRDSKYQSHNINIIGFHGQTVYHNAPGKLTWQIGNPHQLAYLTKINVISDFRRRDIAGGGVGAPLVPIFHKCLMQEKKKPVAVLNIGGVANITYIDDNALLAFDVGPGNALINDTTLKFFGKNYDEDGNLAAQGNVREDVIKELSKHKFFQLPPPKALDRNDFINFISDLKLTPLDLIATLTKFTVFACISGIEFLPKMPLEIYVCGGGAKNLTLINWLSNELKNLHDCKVVHFKNGIDPNFIEAQAFGYLAARYLRNLPGSFPSTTSVENPTVAGVLFPK